MDKDICRKKSYNQYSVIEKKQMNKFSGQFGSKTKKTSKKKNERVVQKFSNPFLKSLRFHQDSILNISLHPKIKNMVFTGSSDGEICSWSLNKEKCLFNLKAHNKAVRGLSIDFSGRFLLSCSENNNMKLWRILENKKDPIKSYQSEIDIQMVKFNPVSHFFLTTGRSIVLWDLETFTPVQKIYSEDISVSCAKFNPLEHNIILSSASDRSIMVHDLRLHLPIKKIFMDMRSNDIIWSPKNPWEFTVANEDSNLYSFDLRSISNIKKTYKGHVMPIQSLDQEKKDGMIVSGSLDRTIRIHQPKSDFDSVVFSSSRMSRVLCVSFSLDNNFILSGSEEGNLRIWKKPEKILDSKFLKKTKKNRIATFHLHRFYEKNFLPKLIFNIKKMKMKLNELNQIKKTRQVEKVLPGNISTRAKFKRPNFNLHI